MSSTTSHQSQSPRKISPTGLKQAPVGGSTAEPDPGQLLNEWLGELDNLQKVSSTVKKGVSASQVIDTFDNRIDEAKPIDFDSGPHVFYIYYPRNHQVSPSEKFTFTTL